VRLNANIERDLARLADGTLAPERAREIEAQVAESPELSQLLVEQRRSLELTRMLDEPAPAGLRTRVESLHKRPAPAMRIRRAGFAGGLAAAAAAVAIAVVAILPSGAGGPTLSAAAAFTLKAPTAPAPAHVVDGTLNLDVDGVPYPFWEQDFGWKAVGKRVDKIDGRTATTVFYKKGSNRIGYTIVTGAPVSVSGKPAETFRNGVRFRSVALNGATVVTWERKNHSCILSGQGMTKEKLVKLASWKDEGELPYSGRG
jgi:hypothetical protein